MKLAIDLGGTNIRIAQVEGNRCLNKTSVACPSQESASTVLELLFLLIGSMMNEQVEGIGIGVPSVVDSEKGIVYDVANISSWKEVHLKDILENKFSVPVAVNNDSNSFALGESLFGEGRPYVNMVGVTVGTGIGAGVIIDRRLYGGQYMGAGEVGSFPYLDADFERYCSSFFFKQCCNTTGKAMAEGARMGEQISLDAWSEFGTHMGNLMKAVLFAYAPQAIILGGGIAASFPFFEKAMKDAMRSYPYKIILNEVKVIASRNENTGLMGAAALLDY